MSKLVIVESPAKAKTIEKYLGKKYKVVASMGHIRDLAKSTLSVDIENDFKPKYSVIRGKSKLVNELKKEAKNSEKVFLATDPDREGEAISWHLAYLLGLDLDDKNRVTFNEITKSGVEKGMSNPQKIDLDLVNAQQARRILDRIVGYKLSPFLSKRIHKGLSAGRVQSVAMRIITDREEEIRKFVPEEYWTIDCKFLSKVQKAPFSASFYGNKKGKIKISSKEEADNILKSLENADYVVESVKKGEKKLYPSPAFITSTLQQEASNKLGFTAKKTMKLAQELYEGIEVLDMGAVGLITYMRTDSLRISNEALTAAREFILNKWGEKYLPEKPRVFKTKASAQDGHEAIRPTLQELYPDKIKQSLTDDQYKLYKLIWNRFMASQMADSILNTVSVDISGGEYIFRTSGHTVKFDGFTILYPNNEKKKEENKVPVLEKGENLNLKEMLPNQHFTQPPARFTEASLIKTLEGNGIGRPSTYATVISTILAREYVLKEGKSLKLTELGEVTTDLMKEHFPNIVDTKFTAQMEEGLDIIAEGKSTWTDLLDNFYGDFSQTLEKAEEETKGVKIHLKEDETDIICEKCGKPMVVKYGRYGKFIGCSGYPECTNIKKIVNETGAVCPKCGGKLIEKKSKKGRAFFGCENYPKCDFASWDSPTKELCPKCGKTLFIKKGKNKKPFCITEGCNYGKEEE